MSGKMERWRVEMREKDSQTKREAPKTEIYKAPSNNAKRDPKKNNKCTGIPQE